MCWAPAPTYGIPTIHLANKYVIYTISQECIQLEGEPLWHARVIEGQSNFAQHGAHKNRTVGAKLVYEGLKNLSVAAADAETLLRYS